MCPEYLSSNGEMSTNISAVNTGIKDTHALLLLCVQSHRGIVSPGRESSCIAIDSIWKFFYYRALVQKNLVTTIMIILRKYAA